MERHSFQLKVKAVDDAGSFTGMAAVYGNVDLGNDVIDPGAFTRTLNAGKSFPVLWQHQPDNPIGTAKVTETREGLLVNGTLMLSDPTAQKAHTFLKAGVVKGLSIGYDAIQATYDGDIRHLKELRLWEVSVVTFPMNELATVSSVKAKDLSTEELQRHLKGIKACAKGIVGHMKQMSFHLKSVLDDGDDLFDGDDADDPSRLEGNVDDQTDDVDDEKALAAELDRLIFEVRELAAR